MFSSYRLRSVRVAFRASMMRVRPPRRVWERKTTLSLVEWPIVISLQGFRRPSPSLVACKSYPVELCLVNLSTLRRNIVKP